MTRESIQLTDEYHWLSLRQEDITSTMTPALFGLSPYLTAFELYHDKKSGIKIPFDVTDRMQKGHRMEEYAAKEIGIKLGMEVRPFKDYIRIAGERIGSSFDWEILHPEKGWGILEIKAVDYFIHKNGWDEEAPDHIEIQLQHQLEVADRHTWGMIAAFTSIYESHEYIRDRDYQMGRAIRSQAKKFWSDFDNNIAPKPDFGRDGDVINEIFRNDNGDIADKTKDDKFTGLCSKFVRLKAEEKEIVADIDKTKAELHMIIGNGVGAFTEQYKFTAGWTKDSQGTLVTEDMVGSYINARRGYRQCLVKDLTVKKGK